MTTEFKALQHICQHFLATSADFPLASAHFENINWAIFIDLVHKHKLQAIVWQTMKAYPARFPPRMKARLGELAQWQRKRKLDLLRAILQIQAAHEAADITILPYKGVAFGQQFYQDIFLRDSNDVDFALEHRHIKASATIMKKLGFVELKEESDFDQLDVSRAYHIDYSWVIYDDQGNILCNAEIHWQPANSALYTTYKFDDLANQSVPLPILNKSVQVFDKVHHALLVIIHHGLVDTWTQLRHLVDLHLILATMTVAEIQTLEKRLTDSKLRYCYDYGVFLCQTILGYQSPATLTSSNSLPIKQQLLKRIVASDMVGKWSENRMKLYYYLRMRDSFVDQLKSIYYFLKFTWFDFRYKKNKMSKEEEH